MFIPLIGLPPIDVDPLRAALTLIITGWLFSLLVSIGTWAWRIFKTAGVKLIDIFHRVGSMIEDALGPVWDLVRKFGKKVWEFWGNVAEWAPDAFRKVLIEIPLKVANLIRKLSKWLDRLLKPAFNIIREVLDYLDLIWEKVIEEMLHWMDRARHVLQFLDILGVEWAGKLENLIWNIENRIYQGFEFIRGWLNSLEDFLYTVLDPLGFIRRVPFLGSLMRAGDDALAILVDVGALPDHAERRAATEDAIPITTNAAVLEAFKDGSLFADPAVVASVEEFRDGRTLSG